MKEKILIVEDQFVEADYLRSMLERAGYLVTGIARSVEQALELIREVRPGFVLVDIFLKGKYTGIDLARQLAEENIPFVYLSANSGKDVLEAAKTTQPYGFLVKPFREKDLLVTLEIARYRHEHSTQHKDRQTSELLSRLKSMDNRWLGFEQQMLNIAVILQAYIPFDYMTVGFNEMGDPGSCALSFLRIGFNEYQTIGVKELQTITGRSLKELQAICKQPSLNNIFADTFQVRSYLSLPLELPDKKMFSFCLYSRRPEVYNSDHIVLFERVQKVLSELVSTILKGLARPGAPAHGVPDKREFEGVIGKSHLLLNIFDLITQVAHSDTSVLILGESGTGKERIADCIHYLSRRAGKPFVKVNCAALPPNLVESELFGHEKGAFTGAYESRIGKFEKAHGSSIFLDEIGEMPMESQVKLLRVLQEKEIERVGGKGTKKIDVRIIAATNVDLEKEVAEGRFRLDLYYRLNVFPITLPPLRDRKEDIPLLAWHFVDHYNKKAGKRVTGISDRVLQNMMAYDWPGNIRELEHLIERSVLLAKGSTIEDILLPVFKRKEINADDKNRIKTIHENEKDHILAVLRKCHGRIWGPGAAAEILNIPPSTLKYRMKKLGIKKEYIP
ncbi:MAG: sigma 54-interacting transcriptional regulator [Chitinophagaceae bacterium]|nr:sigma 54-interacting transcriptional regulator [Chitinophagaceae bacterium]